MKVDRECLNRFGKAIVLCRKHLGWSQQYLSDLVNVSKSTVSNWENGNVTIYLEHLITLTRVLITNWNGDMMLLEQYKREASNVAEEPILNLIENNGVMLQKNDKNMTTSEDNQSNINNEDSKFVDNYNKKLYVYDAIRERKNKRVVEVPKYNTKAAAGGLTYYIDPISNPTEIHQVDVDRLNGDAQGMSDEQIVKEFYVIQVQGDSMYPVIFDGDYLYVRRFFDINELIHRQFYLFSIDDSLLVKVVLKKEDKIYIGSLNKQDRKALNIELDKVFVKEHDVRVVGKVITIAYEPDK